MNKLRTHISLAIAATVLLTVAVTSVLTNLYVDREFKAYLQMQQEQKSELISQNISDQYDRLSNSWNTEALHQIGMNALLDGYVIKVFDAQGASVWDAETHDMALCNQVMAEISKRMESHGYSGEFTTQNYQLERDNTVIGSVLINAFGPFALGEEDFSFIESMNRILLVIGALALVASFIVGFFLARRLSKPIMGVAETARQIAEGDYSVAFPTGSSTEEINSLTSSIHHLAQSLDRQQQLRKQLTADVAHELRTPVTTVGIQLEAMVDGVREPTPERLAACHQEIMRVGKLIADLEKLERMDFDDEPLTLVPTDLLALASSVCEGFGGQTARAATGGGAAEGDGADTEGAAAGRSGAVTEGGVAGGSGRILVSGDHSEIPLDADKMRGVITNLVSNALTYSEDDTVVRLTVKDSPQNSLLIVEDEGIGIAPSDLPYIFERLYRTDKSRNRNTGGAGIGLAIAKSLVERHGGNIHVESTPDQGSRFTITLPKPH